ncbi:MAG: amidohydrolase family protein [Fimbriimonadaceae bacterium]|nr:amidohydrolase family protein [Fimbriimonadaceae bacterium]
MKYVADYLGSEGFGSYLVDWSGPSPTFERVSRPPQLTLVPGFVDIHFHGAFGIDFMSASTEDLRVLCRGLEKVGYESVLMTTVTASVDDVQKAMSQIPADEPMIAGVHLEGPFISPEFPGAQPQSAILDPPEGGSGWDAIFDDPRLKVVTMAPERPRALELITRLSDRGVIVSMGHTNAMFDEARFGFEFGALHATHMFNAMRPFHHREAGAVGYFLTNDAIATEVIYDRIHVSKDSMRLLLKTKSLDAIIAISDSTMATGLTPGTKLDMWGTAVTVERDRVTVSGTETLAGSSITLLNAFQNLAEDFGDEAAIRLCAHNPRRALGIKGEPRVFCEFDKRKELVGLRVLSSGS